jgi:hypothetical protein
MDRVVFDIAEARIRSERVARAREAWEAHKTYDLRIEYEIAKQLLDEQARENRKRICLAT